MVEREEKVCFHKCVNDMRTYLNTCETVEAESYMYLNKVVENMEKNCAFCELKEDYNITSFFSKIPAFITTYFWNDMAPKL